MTICTKQSSFKVNEVSYTSKEGTKPLDGLWVHIEKEMYDLIGVHCCIVCLQVCLGST